MAKPSINTSGNASAKPATQPGGVRRVKTIELILSVIDSKLWPGPITGGMSGSRLTTLGGSSSLAIGAISSGPLLPWFNLGVRVAHRRQIGRARTRVEFG